MNIDLLRLHRCEVRQVPDWNMMVKITSYFHKDLHSYSTIIVHRLNKEAKT